MSQRRFRLLRSIQNIADYYRAFNRREHLGMKVIKVDEDRYLRAAKALHAEVYLKRGFIKQNDIKNGAIGLKADPYQAHSQYFVVLEKGTRQVIATSRQIEATEKLGHNSFA